MHNIRAYQGTFLFDDAHNHQIQNYLFMIDGLYKETWEQDTFEIVHLLRDKNKTFLDIGAWIGPVSMYAAQFYKRVVSIEADKIALRSFVKNTKHLSNVTLIPRAISTDSNQQIYFGSNHTSPRECTLGDSMSQARKAPKYDDDYLVGTINLADIIERYTDISFLKCDIEGGEETLLTTLFQTCHANRINMWLSFHYSWWNEQNIQAFEAHFALASQMLIHDGKRWIDLENAQNCIRYIQVKPFATVLFVMSAAKHKI